MRIVFRAGATRAQIERVERLLGQLRFRYRRSSGPGGTVLGVVGDTSLLADRPFFERLLRDDDARPV